MTALFAGSPEADRSLQVFYGLVCCGCPLAVVGVLFLLVFITVYANRPREK
jgi:hypothetical protein